jgi:hypothetical protein
MSRSGYNECDGWELIRWRGQVASAIKGKRGQAFLRELVAALDAVPGKRLIANSFQTETGEVCALGAVGRARDALMTDLGPDEWGEIDRDKVADRFDIAMAMAAEIMWVNDDSDYYPRAIETPEQRWARVRAWAVKQIHVTPEEAGAVEVPDPPSSGQVGQEQ